MLDALGPSIAPFAQIDVLIVLGIGIIIGIVIGLLPGMGTIVAMALMLPFTFDMTVFQAMAFLLGMYAGGSASGDLTAILIGVPGEATSAALVLDGYPMTKRGEAGRAMGAAVGSSTMGSLIGAAALAVSIPFVRPLVLAFGSPERFLLTVVGVSMVGALSGRVPLKGLIAGAFGFLLAAIGPEAQAGISRYAFGSMYFFDGIPLVPLAIGMFAVPEIVDLHRARQSIAKSAPTRVSKPLEGLRDCGRRWWLITRCSLIGVAVGVVPGLGGSVAQWLAYGHALQTSKTPENFGKGDIDGVLGPGSANNSKEGGGLIPTIAFGIPGTATMAVLLGGFLIVGLRPGPDMFSVNLDVTMFMIWVLVVSGVVGGVLLYATLPLLAKVTFFPGPLVLPFIVLFVFIGAAATTGQIMDLGVALVAGGASLLFRKYGWPIVPVLLGFVLGDESEKQFSISMNIFGMSWLTRPSVIVLILVSLGLVAYSALSLRKLSGKTAGASAGLDEDEGGSATSEGIVSEPTSPRRQWVGDMLLNAGLGGVALFAVLYAQQWPRPARLFPVAIGVAMVCLCLLQAARGWWTRPDLTSGAGPDERAVGERSDDDADVPAVTAHGDGDHARASARLKLLDHPRRAIHRGSLAGIVMWITGLLAITYAFGLTIAFVCFVTAYLRLEGGVRLTRAVLVGVATGVVHHVLFTTLVNVTAPYALFDVFN